MKFHIHPDYAAEAAFLHSIPDGQFLIDEVYCNHRNVVCRSGHYVVKRFKRPTWANCVIYTFFRQNKARRGYDNALRLMALGLETPRPVAWMMRRRFGLVHTCWLVTECLPLPSLREAYQALTTEADREQLRRDFVDYVMLLHTHSIYHRDLNTDNILVRRQPSGRFAFALIDINRLSFGRRPDTRKTLRTFIRLNIDLRQLIDLDESYALLAGADEERTLFYLLWRRSLGRVRSVLHGWVKRLSRVRLRLVLRDYLT